MLPLTHIDQDAVSTRRHRVVVISAPKFAKIGKSCHSHPYMKVFIFGQIWEASIVRVAFRILLSPIRRGQDVRRCSVAGRGHVLPSEAMPSDSLLRKGICTIILVICGQLFSFQLANLRDQAR
jgi:hypothetical protein